MEGTLEERLTSLDASRCMRFQSISSWKVLWKFHPVGIPVTGYFVSIHLFMEGTLEVSLYPPNLSDELRFNPSLHGRYSGSVYLAEEFANV